MTSVDVRNTRRLIALSQYFQDIPAECPYGLDCTAVYHQACFGSLPPALLEEFLAAGYRRNGNTIYAMRCPHCTACIPIRLETEIFHPSRNMRRARARNQELEISVGPLAVTQEKLRLLDRFLAIRYPGRASDAMDYYCGFFLNSLTATMEISFRLSGRLVGVSVVDLAERSLSAVYFYFDPVFEKRSLGTLNILYLNELARREDYRHLYLGYWIEPVAAMAYKARFRPHSLLINGEWLQVD
jgi:leucyl-tRNA---protein transferase